MAKEAKPSRDTHQAKCVHCMLDVWHFKKYAGNWLFYHVEQFAELFDSFQQSRLRQTLGTNTKLKPIETHSD